MSTLEIRGYGIGISPLRPFFADLMNAAGWIPDTLLLTHRGVQSRDLMIVPGSIGELDAEWTKSLDPQSGYWVYRQSAESTSLTLGKGATDLDQLASWSKPSKESRWSIETSDYHFEWPSGFRLASSAEEAGWPLELHGDGGTLIILRGPLSADRVSVFGSMIAPGQELVGSGSIDPVDAALNPTVWMELEYTHDANPWRQRHYYRYLSREQLLVITAQSPQPYATQLATACDHIVQTLRPR